MARKTDAQLTAEAEVIRTQTTQYGNTKEIVAQILEDIIDSKPNVSTGRTTVDVSGTITLDLSLPSVFLGSASIGAPKTWQLSNESDSLFINSFIFTVSGLHAQTMPSNFIMSDPRWDKVAKTWTPLEAATYEASAIFDGTNWRLDITQSLYE